MFVVREPKARQISAAPFRDRVVHHALTQVLDPIFERRFSAHSYACRVGLGSHRALEAAHQAVRRFPFVLKADIEKYFASMDHGVLQDLLARKVGCGKTLELAGVIIDASNPQEACDWYFPGDDLFTPFARRRGLPLGNQTSQFFANVYLDPLDHLVTRELRAGAYCRYVDDFLVFAGSKEELREYREAIVEKLDGLRLRLHPAKSRIYRCEDGVRFLGWRLFPEFRRLCRSNWVAARRRLEWALECYHDGQMTMEEFRCRLMAWVGHARHGNTEALVQRMLDSLTFVPALHCRNVVRGGSWNNNATNVRVSNRNRNQPENRNNNNGFRCVRDEEPPPSE